MFEEPKRLNISGRKIEGLQLRFFPRRPIMKTVKISLHLDRH